MKVRDLLTTIKIRLVISITEYYFDKSNSLSTFLELRNDIYHNCWKDYKHFILPSKCISTIHNSLAFYLDKSSPHPQGHTEIQQNTMLFNIYITLG